jgi:hypothetical protein
MNEKEIETMMRSAKKRQPKEHEISSLIDTSVPPNTKRLANNARI